MPEFFNYLNPISHLGNKHYSYRFPLVVTVTAAVMLELFSHFVAGDPNTIGLPAIFVFISLIIYFSFRDGIVGGLITSAVTVLFYGYIIYDLHYAGDQLDSGIETTFILGTLYFLLSLIIGWLKQTIDSLIEREANEKQRLQAIIQQLPVGIIITDAKGRVTQTNRQTDIILGHKIPTGYQIGYDDVLVPTKLNNKPVAPTQSAIHHTLTTGKPVVGKEYTFLKPNKPTIVRVNASVVKNRAGKTIAAASIWHDVTEEKLAEERKDDFVNMASHELKTPLTSLKLYIDLLSRQLKSESTPQIKKLIANIGNQADKLSNLVNDLLDVSRLQTGKLTFSKEYFRMDRLVAETVEQLQGIAKQKLVYTKSKPVEIYADKFRIYQVVENLITNAVKYSPNTDQIILKLTRDETKLIFSIQDFGIGIDKLQQKKIFDKLYQVTDPKEKTFPGFGMGLYISKEIIKRHHGNIWVDSQKGKGSTFYFTLPLK